MLMLATVAVIGMGCGGIGANGSVSPATFLLPGIGQVQPQNPPGGPDGNGFKESPEVAAYSSDSVR
jgi:hypothetical protein